MGPVPAELSKGIKVKLEIMQAETSLPPDDVTVPIPRIFAE